ncbi:MAG: RNA 3'-terminal phosphate cyclase [Promethearchaeota archaeon]
MSDYSDLHVKKRFVEIDGSEGEGGGSILRLGLGFSVLFKKPVHIYNIRANRTPKGLKTQHLIGAQAIERLTNGKLSKIGLGSTKLYFEPGNSFETSFEVFIRTAGSIGLLAQVLQIASIITPENVNSLISIKVKGGGTFGTGAPDPHYINDITYHYFNMMGYKCKINVIKEGFYPKGGALAEIKLYPLKRKEELKPLILEEQGLPLEIGGTIVASNNLKKPQVCERIKDTILKQHKTQTPENPLKNYELKNSIEIKYVNSLSIGVGLNIWVKFSSGAKLSCGTLLGRRGLKSETLGKQAYLKLSKIIKSGATIDEYCCDQVLPLVYLCDKPSKFRIPYKTSHFKTNLSLLAKFLEKNLNFKKDSNSILVEIS